MSKILVIEDSPEVRERIVASLTFEGFDVVDAEDGEAGLQVARDARPDLIICDILMPRLDGYQTCTLIKHNQKYKNTPVIMLSSKDGIFDKAKGRVVGSDQYLTKPFTRDDLLGAIEQHVH